MLSLPPPLRKSSCQNICRRCILLLSPSRKGRICAHCICWDWSRAPPCCTCPGKSEPSLSTAERTWYICGGAADTSPWWWRALPGSWIWIRIQSPRPPWDHSGDELSFLCNLEVRVAFDLNSRRVPGWGSLIPPLNIGLPSNTFIDGQMNIPTKI